MDKMFDTQRDFWPGLNWCWKKQAVTSKTSNILTTAGSAGSVLKLLRALKCGIRFIIWNDSTTTSYNILCYVLIMSATSDYLFDLSARFANNEEQKNPFDKA